MAKLPLASELPKSLLYLLNSYPRWPLIVATGFFLAAVIVVALSHFAGVDTISIEFISNIQLATGEYIYGPKQKIFIGYVPELNHAILYLTLVPAIVWVGLLFIRDASLAFEKLQRRGRLGKPIHSNRVIEWVAFRNRHVFRIVTPTVLTLAFVFYASSQAWNYIEAKSGPFDSVGFVQGPYLESWESSFNSRDKLKSFNLYKERFNPLSIELEDFIVRRLSYRWNQPQTLELWQGIILDQDNERPYKLVSDQVALESKNFDIRLQDAVSRSLVEISVKIVKGIEKGKDLWPTIAYHIFLVSFVLLEGCFVAFIILLALKIVFWLMTIEKMMPGVRNDCSTTIQLNHKFTSFRLFFATVNCRMGLLKPCFYDPKKHFGLSVLHKPFNHVVKILLIGSLCFFMMYIGQSPKGAFFGIDDLLVIISISSVLGLLVLYAITIRQKLQNAKDIIFDQLYNDSEAESMAATIAKSDLLLKQQAWPTEDPSFLWLLRSAIIMIMLPILAMIGLLPSEFSETLDLARLLRGLVEQIGSHWAGLSKGDLGHNT